MSEKLFSNLVTKSGLHSPSHEHALSHLSLAANFICLGLLFFADSKGFSSRIILLSWPDCQCY